MEPEYLFLDHPSKAGIEIPRWAFGKVGIAGRNRAIRL
jgi:hypothetical protein